MDDCQIAPTVAVMILTFNFQFSIFHAPKAHRALFPLTSYLLLLIFSPFPQGKADGCRSNFVFFALITHAEGVTLF